MPERAVLYARISLDKTGEEVRVTRQMHDMRQLAAGRDYDVVAEVADNDISAAKRLRRPGYERIWHLVTTEQVDHVIVWQSSRLMRSRRDRAEVIGAFGKHRVDVVAVKGPSLDLRSAYGRGPLIWRVLGHRAFRRSLAPRQLPVAQSWPCRPCMPPVWDMASGMARTPTLLAGCEASSRAAKPA